MLALRLTLISTNRAPVARADFGLANNTIKLLNISAHVDDVPVHASGRIEQSGWREVIHAPTLKPIFAISHKIDTEQADALRAALSEMMRRYGGEVRASNGPHL